MLTTTVDGRNPAPVNRWFIHVYPINYKLSIIPGGAGFLPSTVSLTWLETIINQPSFLVGINPFHLGIYA